MKGIGRSDYLRKENGNFFGFRIKMFPTNCDDVNLMLENSYKQTGNLIGYLKNDDK